MGNALGRVVAWHIVPGLQPAKRMDYQLYASGGSSSGEGSGLEPTDVPKPVLRNEEALEALRESIKRIWDGPQSLTTICFYAFYNTKQLLNTAEVSPDRRLLATGFAQGEFVFLEGPMERALWLYILYVFIFRIQNVF